MVYDSVHAVTPPTIAYLLALGAIVGWNLNLILQVFKEPDIHNFVELVRPSGCLVAQASPLV